MNCQRSSCTIWFLIAAGWATLGSCGCTIWPSVGKLQTMEPDPLRLVDAQTREEVPEALSLPLYVEATGTGFGEGIGAGVSNTYMAEPFIGRTGRRFRPYQPGSFAILYYPWGASMLGGALGSAIVIAPGYQSKAFGSIRLHARGMRREPTREIVLELEPSSAPAEELKRVLAIVSRKQIYGGEGADREMLVRWELSDEVKGGRPIQIRFSSSQRKMVEEYLQKAIKRLKNATDKSL